MKTLNLFQGGQEWHAHRATSRNASDAPAMMGASKYMDRNELLRQKATGIVPEVDAAKQRLFDRGHEAEDAARPLVEAMIGDELYPVVGTDDDGYLSASFDGITMAGDTGYEHKLWSDGLAAQVRTGELEPHYYWQMEQQCLVGGLERIIFVCSDGTADKFESMEYRPVPGRVAQLLTGWAQFDLDLASYQHQEVIPAAVAAPVEGFGALVLHVEGRVVECNIDAFKAGAQAFLERLPNADELTTDQDFANAEAGVKACEEAEDRIKAQKAAAMAQAASIDEVFRAVDHIAELIRAARLALDRNVKARKESIRGEIVQGGKDKLAEHIAALNKRLGKNYMPPIVADFGAAIKGKRTIESLRNAVDTLLAAKKIEASEVADRIQINLASLRELAADHVALFPDTAQIVLKQNDDLVALIRMRIAEHQAAEQKRLDAEREKIRQEEEAKAQAKVKAEADAAARQQAANTAALKDSTICTPAGTPIADQSVRLEQSDTPTKLANKLADDGARLKLGDICARLEFTVTAEFLAKRGFPHVATEKSAKLYRACDFPLICASIIQHIEAAADTRRAA